MSEPLRKKTKDSLGWSAMERLTYQFLNFGIQILLARLVNPSEYGLLVLIVIFVTFAQLVIDGGFTQAIIQKDELSQKDISTAFWFNLATSIALYGLLFFASPSIASYYQEPRLCLLIRILAINLVIRSLGLVHLSVLTRELKFKKLFKISIPAMVAAGILGVTSAAMGLEVWALVAFQLANISFSTILLWIYSNRNRRPQLDFSWRSLKSMASFGLAMLGASLVSHGVQNIYGLVIKEYFSFAQLGVYNRARAFHRSPSVGLNAILNRVLFPVFSQIKDDNEKIVSALRSGVPVIVFTVAPLMIFLMIASEEIVLLLLRQKWIGAVELMRWFPIIGITFPIAAVQLSVVRAKGKSGLFLTATIIKNSTALVVLYFTVQHSVLAVVIGQVCVALFNNICVNMPMCAFACGYRLLSQANDVLPYLLAAGTTALATWFFFVWIAGDSLILVLLAKFLLFVTLYLVVNYLFKLEALQRFGDELRQGLARIHKFVQPGAIS